MIHSFMDAYNNASIDSKRLSDISTISRIGRVIVLVMYVTIKYPNKRD